MILPALIFIGAIARLGRLLRGDGRILHPLEVWAVDALQRVTQTHYRASVDRDGRLHLESRNG
jgi:hypothetical protein